MTTLPDAEWRRWPNLARVIDALSADGGAVRYVGGAVRDTVAGLPVSDVDLATPLHPDVVIARLEAAGVKAVPTGIAHGTVTAVSGGRPFEVTTLRRDVATDGRRATVAFAEDWRDDAARRDFTINALYADPESGEIFDWFDGLADLAAGQVRFIGDPAQRIAEDHLRVLRYYRFVARFGRGTPDAASHAAVVAARRSLRTLSRERVSDELLKILALPAPLDIVRQMTDDGVMAEILPEADRDGAVRFEHLLGNERIVGVPPAALRRLAALLPGTDAAETVSARLRLSKRQREHLLALTDDSIDAFAVQVPALAYRIGVEAARDRWLIAGRAEPLAAAMGALAGWKRPQLPVKGGMLVARGLTAGPAVARTLRQIEALWIAAGFPKGKALDALVDQALRDAAQ